MTELEIKQYLASELSLNKLKDFNTTIIIGKAAKVFKKMIRSEFYSLTTAEDVRTFLERWTVPLDTPIIFEDLSLMLPTVQTYLLKFIEEPPAPLIILASSDNISPIILSRCKRIIKLVEDLKYGNQTLDTFIQNKVKARDEIKVLEKEHKDIPEDLNRYFTKPEQTALEDCPDYLYITTQIQLKNSSIRHPDTYIELLTTTSSN